MSYTIDIIDTENDDLVISNELAEAKSIVLTWKGSDEKDEIYIIGSSLSFTMLDENYTDGRFDSLFTGNETRFKVRLYHDTDSESTADDVTIWTGFLLPEQYTEPYNNGVLSIGFEAADGLGRLKGKYLPDSFYTDEKSVIQIISECLLKTGLQLPLYFYPAIENYIEKDYHNIYIDTLHFVDKNKKQDAYKILETLMQDMLCCVYQADDVWYVDGINKRHLLVVDYKHYDYLGNYVETVTHTKLLKEAAALVTPLITIIPPYGEVYVKHERLPHELPSSIAIEENDGWAITTGVVGNIYATHWNGNGDYYATATAAEYKVQLPTIFGETIEDLDLTKYIDLKQKLYVSEGDKMSFNIVLSPDKSPVYAPSTNAYFQNETKIEIYLNSDLLTDFIIGFDNNEYQNRYTLEFDVLAQEAGLLDVRIYQPYSDGTFAIFPSPQTPHIVKYFIEKLELKRVGFSDEFVCQDIVSEDYTIKKEKELTFADDASGFSKAFLLAKLRTADTTYNTISIPILYGSSFNGQYYSVVSLAGANLIADNITTVYYSATLLENLEVVYNYNDGEEMVVLTDAAYTSGSFDVRVYKINDVTTSRAHWQQWTDAVYAIEKNRYPKVACDIYQRLFQVPHYKIDMTVEQSVKFNDILSFPYKGLQNYFITNCSWNIDDGTTDVVVIKGVYAGILTENLPPIVDAGPDKYIDQATTSVFFDAEAYDPDGFIASYFWERTVGDADGIIVSPLSEDTSVTSLNGDFYTYKITVTDNDGATASDTVNVYRINEYTITNTLSCVTDTNYGSGLGSYQIRRKVFAIATTPALASGMTINITVKFTVFQIVNNSNTDAGDYLGDPCTALGTPASQPYNRIEKNGTIIYSRGSAVPHSEVVSFNMVSTDVINFQIESITPGSVNTKCEILSATDVYGSSVLSGLPITVYAYDAYELILSKPIITSAVAASATEVDLNITTSAVLISPGYTAIEYSLSGADDWTVHGNMAYNVNTYTVNGLTTLTSYDFRCKSYLNINESEYSLIKSETTQ